MFDKQARVPDTRRASPAGRQQRGFNLFEVLIALIVLSLGLMGLAALQNMGLRLGNESYQRTQATMLIYEMIDRMRANAAGVQAGNYALALTNTAPSLTKDCALSGTACTAAQMATYDMNQWISTLTGTDNGTNVVQTPVRPALPGAKGSIVSAGSSLYEVSVQWQEQSVAQLQKVKVQLP